MTEQARRTDSEASVGQLVSQLTEQSSQLIREEMDLARLEIKDTVKHAGLGAGLFSTAAVVGGFGAGALVATAIIALDLALPLWLSALIVTVALFVIAAVAGLMGKREVNQVSPTPELTVENVKRDVREVKEAKDHGRHSS